MTEVKRWEYFFTQQAAGNQTHSDSTDFLTAAAVHVRLGHSEQSFIFNAASSLKEA
jgi:hypothetical protein